MISIGIDQSLTSTGVTFLNEKGQLISTHVISSDPKQDLFARIEYIRLQLSNLLLTHKGKDLQFCVEEVAFMSRGNATRNLAGLQHVLINHIRYREKYSNVTVVSPTRLKKFATGNGKSKKTDMYNSLPQDIQNIICHYKVTKGRYDVTDSYWLAYYVYVNNKLS